MGEIKVKDSYGKGVIPVSLGSLGFVVLSIWFILTGLMVFVKFNFPSSNKVMGALAIIAGVLILIGR